MIMNQKNKKFKSTNFISQCHFKKYTLTIYNCIRNKIGERLLINLVQFKSNKVKIKIIYTLRKILKEHNIRFNDAFTLSKGFKILNTLNLLNRDSLKYKVIHNS